MVVAGNSKLSRGQVLAQILSSEGNSVVTHKDEKERKFYTAKGRVNWSSSSTLENGTQMNSLNTVSELFVLRL